MTGDVVWTSASFTGAGNVTGTATIQANAVESQVAENNITTEGAKMQLLAHCSTKFYLNQAHDDAQVNTTLIEIL